MLRLLTLLTGFLLILSCASFAQTPSHIRLTNTQTQTYPLVSGQLFAYDDSGKVVSLYGRHLIIRDKAGNTLENTYLLCNPSESVVPISVMSSLDASNSMTFPNQGQVPYKTGIKFNHMLASALDLSLNEMGYISFDDTLKSYIPYTKNLSTLLRAIDTTITGFNNDFYAQLLQTKGGLLTSTSPAKYKKIAIIETDGGWEAFKPKEYQDVLNYCKTNGIQFYCIIFSDIFTQVSNGISQSLDSLASQTGGKYYNDVVTLDSIVRTIVSLQEHTGLINPCDWNIKLSECDSVTEVYFQIPELNAYDTIDILNPYYKSPSLSDIEFDFCDTVFSDICSGTEFLTTLRNKVTCRPLPIDSVRGPYFWKDSVLYSRFSSPIPGIYRDSIIVFYQGHDTTLYTTIINGPLNPQPTLVAPDTVWFYHPNLCELKPDSIYLFNNGCLPIFLKSDTIRPNEYTLLIQVPDTAPSVRTLFIEYNEFGQTFQHIITIIDSLTNTRAYLEVLDWNNFDTTTHCSEQTVYVRLRNSKCNPAITLDSANFDNKKFHVTSKMPVTIGSGDTEMIELQFDPEEESTNEQGGLRLYTQDSTYTGNYSIVVLPVREVKLETRATHLNNDWTFNVIPDKSCDIQQFTVMLHSSVEEFILTDIFVPDTNFRIEEKYVTDSDIVLTVDAGKWINVTGALFQVTGSFLLGTNTQAQVLCTFFEANHDLSQYVECIEHVTGPDSIGVTYIEGCGTTLIRQLMFQKNSPVKITPNPASNQIIFEWYGHKDPVTIFSEHGQELLTGLTNEPINVSELPSGVYYAKVGIERVMFCKFIVEK